MSNRVTQPPAKVSLSSSTTISLHDRFTKIAKVRREPAITKTVNAEQQKTAASAKNQRLAAQMANRPTVQAALRLKKKSINIRQRIGAKVGVGRQIVQPVVSVLKRRPALLRKRLGATRDGQCVPRMNLYRNANINNNGAPRGGVPNVLRRRLTNPNQAGVASNANRQNSIVSGNGAFVKTSVFRRRNNLNQSANSSGSVTKRLGNRNTNQRFNGNAGQVRPQSSNRGLRNPSGGGNRGAYVNNRFNNNNTRGGGRGMRGGNVRGGRGGRGANRGNRQGKVKGGKPQTPSKDRLDKDLDSYMAKSRNHLDADLDTYMAQA